jgi:TolA-binding protein
MVALGTLQLEKLDDPSAALGSFESYLSTGSTNLAPEALFGKSRALRALGDVKKEKQALTVFINRYPQSPYAKKVSRRLAALGSER